MLVGAIWGSHKRSQNLICGIPDAERHRFQGLQVGEPMRPWRAIVATCRWPTALMLGRLYDALISAGVEPKLAREAAEEADLGVITRPKFGLRES